MAISIGINGFGRIGRVALRIAINQPDTFRMRNQCTECRPGLYEVYDPV